MLHLIPALLLLILNGPANAEQPSQAQWSAAIRALHASAGPQKIESSIERNLLKCSNDPQFTQALLNLLCQSLDHRETPTRALEPRERFEKILPQRVGRTGEGFEECRRSRDGPISL